MAPFGRGRNRSPRKGNGLERRPPRSAIVLAVAQRRQRLLALLAGVERELVGHQGGGVGGLRHGEIGGQVAVQEAGALELGEARAGP